MKILITGGFGYVGGRLARSLAATDTYEIRLGSRSQLVSPRWLPDATVVATEWDFERSLEQACAGVDAVVHLAGMNAQDVVADPVAALEFKGPVTGRLLGAAVRQRVKRFIYVSTAHVYANPLTGLITEETCAKSLHPYATSHRAAEDQVRFASEEGAIEGVVVRLSNAFGAPATEDVNCWMLLVNDLCRQAVQTRQVVLRSTGTQQRNFIAMDDATRAVEHLLECSAEALGNGLFNVGSRRSHTVSEMTELIVRRCSDVLGYAPEIVRLAASDAEVPCALDYCVDKLVRSGFTPRDRFDAEIDSTLEMCRSIRTRASSRHEVPSRRSSD